MKAAEVLAHFQDMGVLADISEHRQEHPRFIIASTDDRHLARECMKYLADSNDYYSGKDRIDGTTEDGVLVSMYVG